MSLAKACSTSLVAISLLLFLSACAVSAPKVTTAQPGAGSAGHLPETVARVNGKEISAAELKRAEKL
jgi:hypothetical protein